MSLVRDALSPGAESREREETMEGSVREDADKRQQELDELATEQDSLELSESPLSTFERLFTTHVPILESLLLQTPTDAILKLSHTSRHLRSFLRSYPTAWKHLSFRLLYPSGTPSPLRIILPGTTEPRVPRQSRPYALDQLLMNVVVPFSPCLKSLELDNTAVSGQFLISTVLHSRRETLEHLSVRGCKNVSLKYHIIPYLMMYGLQYDVSMERNIGSSPATKHLALKSLYTYRCRHHRRRPYLSSSLTRKDSDSEPTHELVNLCHKLGIWTDTAWCSTPAGRCFRRRGYVTMRSPQGSPEVWVVFDRLWRSKNWIGPIDSASTRPVQKDGKLWEHDETGCYGEALGTGEKRDLGEGKSTPAHLRQSHRRFVENIRCDNCCEEIGERCEQCSILMHCVGCRKTLCASCAYERPYLHSPPPKSSVTGESAGPFWWAPGAATSPCLMQDPTAEDLQDDTAVQPPNAPTYPALSFHWCCIEPIFSGGGGISIGTPNRDVDQVRAAPLPRGQGWEDLEYSAQEWSKSFPKYAYGDPRKPDYTLETGHIAMMKWLLGPPDRQPSACPRNLCKDCYDTPQWKVHCKRCSKPLCIEHDLRGLRLRICGYRDLNLEKMAIQDQVVAAAAARSAIAGETDGASSTAIQNAAASGFDLPYRTHRFIDSTTSSFTEDHGDAHPLGSPSAGPSHPPRRRSRSISVSNSNQSRSRSPSFYSDSPLEHQVAKWQGCQSFFCPTYREIGDQRERCATVLRKCFSCSVYVCQECVTAHPPCKCSYCEMNYLCPNCAKVRDRDGTCRRAVEERALHEEKMNRDLQMLQRMLETKFANEVAEFAGQFFDTVEQCSPNATHLEEASEHEPETQSQTPQHSASAQQNDVNESLPALLVHSLLGRNE